MGSSLPTPMCVCRHVFIALAFLSSLACGIGTAPESNPGLVLLVSSDTTDTADAFRQILITAKIDTNFRLVNASVSFTTTEGSFTTGSNGSVTVTANDTGLARVELKAPSDSSNAIVTAVAGGRAMSLLIGFLPAPPTWITLAANPIEIRDSVGFNVQLTATIGRDHGTPSSGTPIDFGYELVGSGSLKGHLTKGSQFPMSNQSAVVSFVVDSADTGTVRAHASATRGGLTIADTVVFRVKP